MPSAAAQASAAAPDISSFEAPAGTAAQTAAAASPGGSNAHAPRTRAQTSVKPDPDGMSHLSVAAICLSAPSSGAGLGRSQRASDGSRGKVDQAVPSQPSPSQPCLSQPGPSQPSLSQPGPSQPSLSQPGNSNPGPSQPSICQANCLPVQKAAPGSVQKRPYNSGNGPSQAASHRCDTVQYCPLVKDSFCVGCSALPILPVCSMHVFGPYMRTGLPSCQFAN